MFNMCTCVGEACGVESATHPKDDAMPTPEDNVQGDIQQSGEIYVYGHDFLTTRDNIVIHTGCHIHLPLYCPITVSLLCTHLATPNLLCDAYR
jgi:hypothetical protein